MHDRRNSGKSTLLTVIGIAVVLLGIILVVSPVLLPSLATGANPPTITACSVLYQAQYSTSITTIPINCNVIPASGSGIQSVVFRYAQTTMTPSEANDPTNDYANARLLQWVNITLTPDATVNIPGYSNPYSAPNLSVDQGFYYYYVFNAYAFDGSSNYFPIQSGTAIVNNWFEVGNAPSGSSTPTPTPAPLVTVSFTAGQGGSIQWTDSAAGTSNTVSGTSSASFTANDALNILAVPETGYQFENFYISSTGASSTTNPYSINVLNAFTITANFVPSTSTSPTPTPNPNASPIPTPTSTPTPTLTSTPTPTSSPTSAPYNPFTSPTPAPYTTVTSWVLVVLGTVIALSGFLLVAVAQTGKKKR